MQIYIKKNNEKLGPFDENKVPEMISSGEVSLTDFILRYGDPDWSAIGNYYRISNLRIVKLTLKTGLEIGYRLSDYQPTDIIYLKVPVESAEDFSRDYLQRFYTIFLGTGWQDENADGSKYTILDSKVELPADAELSKADWRENNLRTYLSQNGRLEKVESAEFVAATTTVEKVKNS
jgi:GYF domain 2